MRTAAQTFMGRSAQLPPDPVPAVVDRVVGAMLVDVREASDADVAELRDAEQQRDGDRRRCELWLAAAAKAPTVAATFVRNHRAPIFTAVQAQHARLATTLHKELAAADPLLDRASARGQLEAGGAHRTR